MNNQIFLCPGLVFLKPNGEYIVVTYVWGSACDVINLTTGNRGEMASHSFLRCKAQHIGNNYKRIKHD